MCYDRGASLFRSEVPPFGSLRPTGLSHKKKTDFGGQTKLLPDEKTPSPTRYLHNECKSLQNKMVVVFFFVCRRFWVEEPPPSFRKRRRKKKSRVRKVLPLPQHAVSTNHTLAKAIPFELPKSLVATTWGQSHHLQGTVILV